MKATFFVVGKPVLAYGALVQGMLRAGHELENHSFSHYRLDEMSPKEIMLEVQAATEIIERYSRRPVRYFRPPGGRYNRYVLEALKQEGLKMVLWDVNLGDYHTLLPKEKRSHYPYADNTTQTPAKELLDEAMRSIQNGSIFLLHNTDGETIRVLPMLIQALRKKGYRFVTLSELFGETSR